MSTLKEFADNIYTNMKVGEYVVTEGGIPKWIVTVRDVKDVLITEDDYYTTHYKCGDLKEDGEMLCRKHGVL